MPDMLWSDDAELFALARRELYTAAVGAVMDHCKFRTQFLPPEIKPLVPEMVVIGRAMTVLETDIFDDSPKEPFGLMFKALDDLQANEIYVCAGGSARYAMWSETMSMRALRRGASGAVVEGYARDTRGIVAMGFPTFSRGSWAQDQRPRGKVIDFRCPVEINGVRIENGDIVFGDIDGVCVVPKSFVQEFFMVAFERVRKEKAVRRELEAGATAVEVFQKHGLF